LQDTLSNFFAGIHIILSRQIRIGDFIQLDSGEEGYVVDINWRNTTIQKITNNMIIIPNTKLAATIVTNYYQPMKHFLLRIGVGVSYDSHLEHVEKVTMEVADQVLKAFYETWHSKEPISFRFHTFNDFSIDFNVLLPVREFRDKYPVQSLFVKRLHERYNEEGIVIPFPIRTLHVPESERFRFESMDSVSTNN
jgi:small-conductance mechanosensitive channel